MQFKPKSEDDIKRESLAPVGEYDFEVTSAEDKVSKNQSEMIALKLNVYVDGKPRQMRDWLLESMAYKLRHFCGATGLLPKYEAGTLKAEDCVGRAGRLTVIIKDDPQYGPQNSIKDYMVPKATTEPAMTPAPAPMRPVSVAAADDQVPF
jgi:hypothetical protein